MVSQTYGLIQGGTWWPAVFPALAIASLVIAVNLIADSVESVYAVMSDTLAPARTAALKVDDLQVAYLVRGIPREVLRGVSFEVAPGRGVRARRRVRMRQVDHRLRRAALPAVERPHHRRARPRRRRRRDRDGRRRAAPVPRPRRVDGVPGSRLGAEPGVAHRAPGRRVLHAAGPVEGRGEEACTRGVAARAHRRSGAGHAALPAPALGRDAATGRDRHGAGIRPEAARARRADHRTRRHRRGRGARPRARPAHRHRRGDPADRPQPRRDPHDVRPGRRDVRRQGRRGGSGPAGVRRSAAPVHGRPAQLPAAPRHPQGRAPADDDPRHAAPDRHAVADVRVRRPLPARHRDLPRRGRPGRRSRPGRWTRCHHADRIGEILAADHSEGVEAATSHRVVFEMQRRVEDVPPAPPRRPGARRCRPRPRGGRDARARRRVGLRQVDPGQGDARHPCPRRGRRARDRRARSWRARPAIARPTSGVPCRWCSRTPTRRSTATGPCGGSSSGRSSSSPGSRGARPTNASRSSPSRCGSRRATST